MDIQRVIAVAVATGMAMFLLNQLKNVQGMDEIVNGSFLPSAVRNLGG